MAALRRKKRSNSGGGGGGGGGGTVMGSSFQQQQQQQQEHQTPTYGKRRGSFSDATSSRGLEVGKYALVSGMMWDDPSDFNKLFPAVVVKCQASSAEFEVLDAICVEAVRVSDPRIIIQKAKEEMRAEREAKRLSRIKIFKTKQMDHVEFVEGQKYLGPLLQRSSANSAASLDSTSCIIASLGASSLRHLSLPPLAPGTLVLARLGRFPPWPGEVADEPFSRKYRRLRKNSGDVCIQFLSTYDVGFCKPQNIRPLTLAILAEEERRAKKRSGSIGAAGSQLDEAYSDALDLLHANQYEIRCTVCARAVSPPLDGGLEDKPGDTILLCDGCNSQWHLRCCLPPLESVPDGDFFCAYCVRDGRSGSPPRTDSEGDPSREVASAKGKRRARPSSPPSRCNGATEDAGGSRSESIRRRTRRAPNQPSPLVARGARAAGGSREGRREKNGGPVPDHNLFQIHRATGDPFRPSPSAAHSEESFDGDGGSVGEEGVDDALVMARKTRDLIDEHGWLLSRLSHVSRELRAALKGTIQEVLDAEKASKIAILELQRENQALKNQLAHQNV